jgi:hypothetical protein
MSINNIFEDLEDQIVECYAKVPNFMLSGTRLDPHDPKKTIPWIIKTESENFDLKTKTKQFVYEDEVIELYSKLDLSTFLRFNKGLIENGLLKKYEGNKSQVDTSETITDVDLTEIVNIRANDKFIEEVNKLNSVMTLTRLKNIATDSGKSVKKIALIDTRIEELLHGDN